MASKRKSVKSFDTGRTHLGHVYAKALLAATEKQGATEQVLEELRALVTQVLDKVPQIEAVMSSPRISHTDRIGMIDRSLGGKVHPLLLNLLRVLSLHTRGDCLRHVLDAAEHQYNVLRGRLEVLLTTAAPLSPKTEKAIIARLEKQLGQTVLLKTAVDDDLLGGMVVRIGDTVFDGSVATRLKTMKTVALEHTSQKIRDSLDRFAISQ